MNTEKSVFLSDIHAPFQNTKALKCAYKFIESFKPDVIYLLGDIIDFYAISTFDKDPARITSLQSDINACKNILKNICKYSEKVIYIEGNHEDRLRRYIWKHPELESLDSLKINALLGLDDLNISYHDINDVVRFHGFVIEHGDTCRSQSGYTARAMLDKRGTSGISGHTHRMGAHFKTTLEGSTVWYENGCLCNLIPEYVRSPNWLNGFSIGYFKHASKRFSIEQIPIIDNKVYYAGEEYK